MRYPNVALNPFVGSETMVKLFTMLDTQKVQSFWNVWERLEGIESMAEEKKNL